MAANRIIIGLVIGLSLVFTLCALIYFDTTGSSGNHLGKEYTYDMDKLTEIDPNLFLYEPDSIIETSLVQSKCIGVDDFDTLYIGGDQVVKRFSTAGDLIDVITLKAEILCLAPENNKRLFLGFKDHLEVYDIDTGNFSVWKSLGAKAVLTAIAIGDNELFTADAGNKIIWHYDLNGKLLGSIGARDKDSNKPGFIIPSPYFDLALSSDGLLRVANPGCRRIETYTRDGDYEFAWGSASAGIKGFCGCCNPANFAMGPDDEFITCEKGLVRVKVYDSDGAFMGVVAGPKELMPDNKDIKYAFDVAVDKHARVYVLDTVNQIVRIFKKKQTGNLK